jgi:Tol biopolymer transport system component
MVRIHPELPVRPAASIVIAAAAVLALAVPAEATFPGRNGRIALTAVQPGNEPEEASHAHILSIRPDGSGARLLAGPAAEHPAYRPDGHVIAFSRFRNVRAPSSTFDYVYRVRDTGIFLMRSDGTGKRRLVPGPYSDPDWSPDGVGLVFTRTRRPRGIVTWRPGSLRRVSDGFSPAWSPTGELIVFERSLPKPPYGAIYIMRPDGTGIRQLAVGGAPEWSPDGRRVIFNRTGFSGTQAINAIYSIRPDGTDPRPVPRVHGTDPVYSPNGRRIGFTKNLTDYGWNDYVMTMRPNGGHRRRLFAVSRSRKIPESSFTFGGELDWQPRPAR